jgi:pimeloyl-ACP methyl ester carboxylesterase
MEKRSNELSRRGLLTLAGAAAAAVTTGCGGASAATSTVPTARLFYTDSGVPTGKNVMLLHGWTCDSHDWSWQLPALEAKCRVVAVDLRGHGRSEVMPSGAYMPADYVADIESLIATTYAGQKFVRVGHSWGGQIAARRAAQRPDLVSAVVSVDGSLGFSDDLAPVFQKATSDLASGDPGVVGPALFEAFYDAATPAAFKRWHARRLQGTPLHVVRESFGPLFLGAGQVGVGAASEAFCKSLTLPVYHLCRFPEQAAAMSKWFSHPRSKVELWTNAGHWIQQDRPDAVNAAAVAWIDAL